MATITCRIRCNDSVVWEETFVNDRSEIVAVGKDFEVEGRTFYVEFEFDPPLIKPAAREGV